MANLNSPLSLQEIEAAWNFCQKEGYTFNIFNISDTNVHCILTKSTYGKVQVKVEGSGKTVHAAVEAALRNFPVDPLDGSRWENNRLEAPKPQEPEDISYIEVNDPEPQSD